MRRAKGVPPELGERVAGQVLDAARWEQESRIRRALPYRHVVGEVRVVYPFAPRVVGVVLGSGEQVHVHLSPLPACAQCGHTEHETGDCLVAGRSAEGFEDSYCLCGAPGAAPDVLSGQELADALEDRARARERAE